MKWFLAGLAFALLVTLAILTVGIKAQNLRLRKRIAEVQQRLDGLLIEQGRRALLQGEELSDEELRRRLRLLAGMSAEASAGGQD